MLDRQFWILFLLKILSIGNVHGRRRKAKECAVEVHLGEQYANRRIK
jgi:hypothetical protein